MDPRPRSRAAIGLLLAYVVVWALLAISPRDRYTWFMENALTFLFVPLLVLANAWRPLSNVSYSLLFAYLVLHAVGGHYGYSHVPGPWSEWGFERNHYDRVVHFLFGLLLAYPLWETLVRLGAVRGPWSYYLTFAVLVSFSAFYEIIEWLAVLVTPGPTGEEFLGSQGDDFDAMKDMALAAGGALLALSAAVLAHRRRRQVAAPST